MKLSREQIRAISLDIANVVDAVVREHRYSKTQEHQLTARIGQAIEMALNGKDYGGASAAISIVTQDVPDKGRGSLEKPLGSDIYIGVSVAGEFDKGLLVQAKRAGNERGLFDQCNKMLRQTRSSYVWEYDDDGLRVKRAQSVVNAAAYVHGDRTWQTNVQKLFEGVFECTRGDRTIGVPAGPDRRHQVGLMLERFATDAAVSIELKPKQTIATHLQQKERIPLKTWL